MATLTVKDFDGGKTDFPVGSDSNKFENADNTVINEYRDLESRPGTLYDFTTSGIRARVSTNDRIGLMAAQYTGAGKTFTIIKQSAKRLFYDNGSTRVELVGPGSASAFDVTSMDSTVSCAFSSWNEHTYMTHESPYQIPVKVYRDASGVLQLRTAGLPVFNGSGVTATGGAGATYVYAFVYKYTYNVGTTEYIDRGRPVSNTYTNIGTVTPAASPGITVGSIPTLSNGTGEHFDTANIKVEIYRTTNAGSVLFYVGEVTNGTATYSDTTSDTTLAAANVPIYTTAGGVSNDRPPKCKYVHSTSDFTFWAHGFEVSTSGSDNEFIPQRVWQSKRGDPDSVPSSFYADIEEPITGISSIKSVPIIFGNNSVYRLDGTFDTQGRGGMFPRKISDKVGCVGHLSIVQTLDGLYFAGNDGFYFTDGYKIYSISAEDFKATYANIVETELQKKRIYGEYDALTKRILWAVHDPMRDTATENNAIFCMYVPVKKFTTWSSGYDGSGPYTSSTVTAAGNSITMGSTAGIDPGDSVRVVGSKTFGLYVVSVDSTTMLTLNGSAGAGSVSVEFFNNEPKEIDVYGNFQPSSLLAANNVLWQGDGRGFTLQYNTDTLSDVQIDEQVDSTSGTAITPVKRTILFNYSGPILDLGTTEVRKWVNSVLIKIRPRSDVDSSVAVQPFGENDDNDYLQALREVVGQSLYPWGTPLLSYGDPRLYRRRQQIFDEQRRFPKNSLRCEYKQIHLKSSFTILYNSDSLGTGTLTAGSNGTFVLTIGNDFASDLYNSWLSFGDDDYVANYKVISQTSNTLTIIAPEGVTAGSNVKWVLRAYPVNNFINLIEYSYFYEIMSSSQTAYQGVSGANT